MPETDVWWSGSSRRRFTRPTCCTCIWVTTACTACCAAQADRRCRPRRGAAGIDERYVREWLEHEAVAGVLDVASPGTYVLPEEHAPVLVDETDPSFLVSLAEGGGPRPRHARGARGVPHRRGGALRGLRHRRRAAARSG